MEYYHIGDIVDVNVTAVESYGAFVKVDEVYTGLIHISEITGKFIDNINNYIKVGDIISAKIIDIDNEKKHIKLTSKGLILPRKNSKAPLVETDLGFFLLKDLLPKWIKDKIDEMKKCK